ncbi:MAG: YabP/YqfC family sporulation protein [Oscillospiraceae bacterium]|nr:YabP/YqfC family sporulation protein [Oscillospiraceae bacterium]
MRKKFSPSVTGWVYLDTYLHLHGNEQLKIENCRRILEYNEVLVRLQTLDMTIEIWGTGLRVFDYNDSSVTVTGKISSLNLTEKS